MEEEMIVDDIESREGLTILTLASKNKDIKIIFELPDQILREANISPEKDSKIFFKMLPEEFEENEWKVYAEGIYYLRKKENENTLYYISVGGLQLKVISKNPINLLENNKILSKFYIGLK